MALYVLQCVNHACRLHKQPQEHVAPMRDRDLLRCTACGGALDTHYDQLASVKKQREWHGQETTSLDIAFAKDADVDSIKRDCPSIELTRDKFGLVRPVFRNDRHHRQVMKEMSAAAKRHQEAEKARTEGVAS